MNDRFILLYAPSLQALTQVLNTAPIGLSRVVSVEKDGDVWYALVDSAFIPVLTREDYEAILEQQDKLNSYFPKGLSA